MGVKRLYQVPRWFTRAVCAVALTLMSTWAIVTGMLMMTGLAGVAVDALLTTVVARAWPWLASAGAAVCLGEMVRFGIGRRHPATRAFFGHQAARERFWNDVW